MDIVVPIFSIFIHAVYIDNLDDSAFFWAISGAVRDYAARKRLLPH